MCALHERILQGGTCHLKFSVHKDLEVLCAQFGYDTLGLMWSARRLKHDNEERVFEGRLTYFHVVIRTPSGD